MIGSLLKFDCEKRELLRPTSAAYKQFDQQVGLCTEYSINDRGIEHVRVKWLKPVAYHSSAATVSDFALDNFIVVGGVSGGV